MWWWRRDVAIASRYVGASFRLTREDKAEFIEGVDTLKYLGQMLDRLDYYWPEVLRNFSKMSQVWSRLGKIPQR